MGERIRSPRGFSVWRNCCQLFRNRMYFLKLLVYHVLASSCSWVLLFSVLCLPVEPMAGEVTFSRESTQTLPITLWFKMQNLGSDSQDKVPTFMMPFGSPGHWLVHFYKKRLFWVTWPLINAFLQEKVEKKKKRLSLLPNRWHPKIPTEMEEVHFPAAFPPSWIYFNIYGTIHSQRINKVKAT